MVDWRVHFFHQKKCTIHRKNLIVGNSAKPGSFASVWVILSRFWVKICSFKSFLV